MLHFGAVWSGDQSVGRGLRTRGVECFRPDDIGPGSKLTPELLHHLEAADFVGALVDDAGAAPNVMFELGAAYNLRKPIILFTTTYDRLLGRPPVSTWCERRSTRSPRSRPTSIASCITPGQPPLAIRKGTNKSKGQVCRGPETSWQISVVRRAVTEAAASSGWSARSFGVGGEVVQAPSDEGADLIVWLDDVAYEVGGPMIVQCKHYGVAQGASEPMQNTPPTASKHISMPAMQRSPSLSMTTIAARRHRPWKHQKCWCSRSTS